jgi:hypothetical protein
MATPYQVEQERTTFTLISSMVGKKASFKKSWTTANLILIKRTEITIHPAIAHRAKKATMMEG